MTPQKSKKIKKYKLTKVKKRASTCLVPMISGWMAGNQDDIHNHLISILEENQGGGQEDA